MLRYIFVHGLAGWGSYDEKYQEKPYWGMRGGDLMQYLRDKGFDCAAASVAPHGSAWDRACELYAQLAGTRVDYGVCHSKKYRHERFGRDFSDHPLITWDSDTQLVLIGHSFGGATVRLFSEILVNALMGAPIRSGPNSGNALTYMSSSTAASMAKYTASLRLRLP